MTTPPAPKPLDLAQISARHAIATPGPWAADHGDLRSDVFRPDAGDGGPLLADISYGDAEFIAAAHDDVPELVAEVQRLREIIAGSDRPPTDAEIATHAAAGGRWLVAHLLGSHPLRYVLDPGADDARSEVRCARPNCRWWPLDASGAPTQRPVVTP